VLSVRPRRSVDLLGWIVTGRRTGVVRYPGGPIDRLLERGDTVIWDLSVRVTGCWSACTTTLVVEAAPSAE
jgi:hypothetical protein